MEDKPFYLPLHFNLRGKTCLFVGGGRVNERRIFSVLASGARVVLVSPEATQGLRKLADSGRIEWRCRLFKPDDLDGVFLAFVAVDCDPAPIVNAARARGVPFNLASAGRDGDFIVPSVVRQGNVVVSLSTSGTNPSLTKRLTSWLQGALGDWLVRDQDH